MSCKFRMTVEIEMPDRTTSSQAKAAVEKKLDHGMVQVKKVSVVDESPAPGVQAAFIYDSGGHGECHAVVKKKNGPWSENRFGFCGIEPNVGPVASLDNPDGGLCSTCRKFVQKESDGLWYVKLDPPLPRPKSRATLDCGGCDDD
jgi:hypothetical protein